MKRYNYIIIDLDGTILEDKYRQYNCYKDITSAYGDFPLDINTFWDMKRKKVQWNVILNNTNFQNNEKQFLEEWKAKIESDYYLKFSVLKKDARVILTYLNEIADYIILATNRRNQETFFRQIDYLKIRQYFNDISVGSEEKMSRGLFSGLEGKVLVIGDTEDDELLARKYGFEFAAIVSGIREKNLIKGDYYIDDLMELKNIV